MQRYKPLQETKRPDANRPRRSAHSSKLPYWLASRPTVQKFMRLSRKRKIMLMAWTGGSFLVISAMLTTIYFANSLSSKERIMNRNKTGVILLDRNGKEYYRFYNARTDTHVPLSKISKSAQQAAIASEDKDFYKHSGFSPKGIAGAVWQNIRPSGSDGGGSTITQQLVASSLLDKRRSYIRKYQELILSIEIERRYSKDEILEMYLNSVYFGEGVFGIQDAAKAYFNKNASELTLAESSMLIGLLPAPSIYSPLNGDDEKAEIRQSYVLGRMEKDGYINQQQAANADKAKLVYNMRRQDQEYKAPHFALMVKKELEEKYDEEEIARSGFRVKTSLDLSWQNIAEKAVKNQVENLRYSNVSNGAVVIIDPKNGQIRAVVGSHDWDDPKYGKLNIATATRQPGSSFKPIVYATGIENRDFTAATTWDDKPINIGGYSPKNYDLSYRGKVTTRRALSISLNIPAVLALQETGIDKVISQAKDLGITTLSEDIDYGLPLALGSAQANLAEMTNVYAAFAKQGKQNDKTTLMTISDKNGKTIYEDRLEDRQAISPQTAYIVSSMLSDPTARGEVFGGSLNLYDGRIAAVKTGTTENYRDAWTIGYTPSIAVGVWIGNNDNSEMSTIAGSSGAAPIWRNVMGEILKGSSFEQFPIPDGLTTRSICRNNGALAQKSGANTLSEYFLPGTLPAATCNEEVKKPVKEVPVRREEEEQPDTQEEDETTEIIDPENPTDSEDGTPTDPADPEANSNRPSNPGRPNNP